MKNNPVKRRLKNYNLLEPEIGFLTTEVRTAQEMLETLSGFHIELEDDVRAKVDERIRKLNERIEELKKEKALIESVIDGLEDETIKRIFKLKYFSVLPWPDISKMVGYCESQCRRIDVDTIENIISKKLSER